MTDLQTTTTADHRTLTYTLSGPPTGPIIMLSNPLATPLQAWEPILPSLHKAGYRILRYDPLGHGGSSPPTNNNPSSTTFDTLAADAHTILHAAGIRHLHAFIGVSLGAATGVYLAAAHPDLIHTLLLISTPSCSPARAAGRPHPTDDENDIYTPRIRAAAHDGHLQLLTEELLARWFAEPWRRAHPAALDRLRRLMVGTSVPGFQAALYALADPEFDLRTRAGRLGSAVERVGLVVGGREEEELGRTMDALRDLIEGGFAAEGREREVPLVVLPGAGHVGFVERPEGFVEVVLGMLDG